MSITFTYSETSITLPSPNYPAQLRPKRIQVVNAAIGGRIDVTDLGEGVGGELINPALAWKKLPDSDYQDLYDFINTTVNRSELSFTFTDWNAVSYTVRYWRGLENFALSAYGHWIGTLELREVPS